ncbi:MAG: 3'-5' exonuclease domain-containing protein 2 [Mediterranea sp.]|jgi:ribonuclease D|nr:3'-5' exonuclease domain-containing protein 2 [Mediterranea sp.]
MVIKRNINKEDLGEMPKAVFPGKISVVQTKAEAKEAIKYLAAQKVVGIDSETRPSFSKGQHHKVALLQISSEECCFLFRLNQTGLTAPVIGLLENPSVIKVGLALRDDFLMLRKRAPFKQQSCIDLQEYVNAFGIQDKSLQKIYAILFGEKISKSQQLSNWDTDVLTPAQELYAATDAWACLKIYNLLERLKQTGDYAVMPEEPEARVRAKAR